MGAVTTVVHPIFVFRSSRITTEEVIMVKTNV
ncbi:acetolactate decarboxylase, partial [Limosilactobacillus fermentum]|nr:acetolactate decarboxylase [Limosilactobacillus fermentum]